MIHHPIPPVFDEHSSILILGSFPSVKSRESGFFYGHPQNRFWQVTAAVFSYEVPKTIADKKDFLLSHHIALWDVIASCEITGSSDSSIASVEPNDLHVVLTNSRIQRIFTNGKTAEKLYKQYLLTQTGIESVCLPSTSPANAAWPLEKLVHAWSAIIRESTNSFSICSN